MCIGYCCTGLKLLLTILLKQKKPVWQIKCWAEWVAKRGLLTERSGTARIMWSNHSMVVLCFSVCLLLQPSCFLIAIPIQIANVRRLVTKAMVCWHTRVDRYKLSELACQSKYWFCCSYYYMGQISSLYINLITLFPRSKFYGYILCMWSHYRAQLRLLGCPNCFSIP